MIDFSQVDRFAARLQTRSSTWEAEETDWKQDWGDEVVSDMQRGAPRLTGRLAGSISQTAPGVIDVGAPYAVYVERGTSDTPPQPFVRPSINRLRPRATRDALKRSVRI